MSRLVCASRLRVGLMVVVCVVQVGFNVGRGEVQVGSDEGRS